MERLRKYDNIYTQQVKVIDPNGKPIRVDVNFYKTDEDEWDVYINRDPTDPEVVGNPVLTIDLTEKLPTDESFNFEYNPDVKRTHGRSI